MKNTTKTIVILLLLFIVVLFAVINAQPITINFIFTKQRVPLVLIIIRSVITGALLAFLGTVGTIWKTNRTVQELNQHITDLKTAQLEGVENQQVNELEQKLKESQLEISDLRHKLVNQMMSSPSNSSISEEESEIIDVKKD